VIPNDHTFGFRIRGSTYEPRIPINYEPALRAYAACDPLAKVTEEAYLSQFTFPVEFVNHLGGTGSVAGYVGSCWAPFLRWDIDRENDLALAHREACRLALHIEERFGLASESDLLIFFTGSKGFSLELTAAIWSPEPSLVFNAVARQFAITVAEGAGLGNDAKSGNKIDFGVYDKVRPYRAPNSRHKKTGLHKRRLSLDELTGLTIDRICEVAREPEPFDLPEPTYKSERAAADWQAAEEWVRRAADEREAAKGTTGDAPRLNRMTRMFIAEGAAQGDRHRLLYSAACNLAEFGCPPALAHALLTEPALDSGLTPSDVRRQIGCGLEDGAKGAPTTSVVVKEAPAVQPSVSPAPPQDELQAKLKALWEQHAAPQAQGNQDSHASGALALVLGVLGPGAATQVDLSPEDEAELEAEREAIRAEGCGELNYVAPPAPPAGAQLFYSDDKGRACKATEAAWWTWAGHYTWYSCLEHPAPDDLTRGGGDG
jgi:hypothetical protein